MPGSPLGAKLFTSPGPTAVSKRSRPSKGRAEGWEVVILDESLER